MKAVRLLKVRTSVRQQDSISSQLSSLFFLIIPYKRLKLII